VHQPRLVEKDLQLVALALVVKSVVHYGVLQLLFIELGLLLRALLHHREHLEEVESVENDAAHHLGFTEGGRFGVSLYLIALLLVQGLREALVDVLADLARVEALHSQEPVGTHCPLSPAELTVAASRPDERVCGLEVLVHNEPSVIDQPTLVDEVEVLVFDVLGA